MQAQLQVVFFAVVLFALGAACAAVALLLSLDGSAQDLIGQATDRFMGIAQMCVGAIVGLLAARSQKDAAKS